MTTQCRGGGYHDLRQRRADGDHRGTDDQLRHMEPMGDPRGTVYEPVTALDQKDKTKDEQQNRY